MNAACMHPSVVSKSPASVKPDFAFALGRHCDMADEARFLIESRIPFAMEKPCALNAAEAHDIARRAAAAGAFAAVPLVMRYCPMIATIREIAAGEEIQYLSFKFVGGMVDRYHQQKVEWVIDRSISGGGPLLNLGIHHVDLCRALLNNADLTVASKLKTPAQNLIPLPTGTTQHSSQVAWRISMAELRARFEQRGGADSSPSLGMTCT